MNITLYSYDNIPEIFDYSFAKSVKVVEKGKTYEITDQGDRKHWFPVEKYRLEVTE